MLVPVPDLTLYLQVGWGYDILISLLDNSPKLTSALLIVSVGLLRILMSSTTKELPNEERHASSFFKR